MDTNASLTKRRGRPRKHVDDDPHVMKLREQARARMKRYLDTNREELNKRKLLQRIADGKIPHVDTLKKYNINYEFAIFPE